MADNGQQHFAERMFPEPVDPGFARPTARPARSSTGPTRGRRASGATRSGTRAAARSARRPSSGSRSIRPPTASRRRATAWEPVRIGILVDMELGQLLADWIDPTILAIEDAMNEGVYDRPDRAAHGRRPRPAARELPQGRKGYLKLVEEGCVVVLGPDDLGQLREHPRPRERDRRRVHRLDRRGPVLRRLLLHRRQRRHPRRVHHGRATGASRTATRRSASSGSWARRAPTTATASERAAQTSASRSSTTVSLGPNPVGIEEHLATMRDRARRPSSTWATATPRSTSRGFDALGWDPPRFMGTAFMFYSNTNEWAEGLEGWHGVDQLGEDGMNPNYDAMHGALRGALRPRVEATSSSRWRTTPRAPAIHGIANATIATPKEVKLGLEKIKWMPCTNGGPATYVTFAPVRPPRLQGRLPRDPPPAQREVRVRRLPPPAMAVQHRLTHHAGRVTRANWRQQS